jgi:hypothetical protein
LAAELRLLQRFGSLALTADLTDLDRDAFERALHDRATEVERTVKAQRPRLSRQSERQNNNARSPFKE